MKRFTEGAKPLDNYSPDWTAFYAANPGFPRAVGADVAAAAAEVEAGAEGEAAAAEGTTASTAFYEGGGAQAGIDMVLANQPGAEGAAEGEADEGDDGEGEVNADGTRQTKVAPWLQRRMDKERAKRGEAERRAQAAENTVRAMLQRQAEMAPPENDAATPPATPPARREPRAPTREEYIADVQRTAQQMAAMENFNAKCNAVADAGSKAFGDFNEKAEAMKQLYDPTNAEEASKFHGLLEAVIEVGGADAHKIYYEIANDLDKASELMELTPLQLGTRLAKMAAPKTAAPVSAAPRPIRPVRGSGDFVAATPSDPSRADRMSTADWMKTREAELEASPRGRHRR